MDMLIIIIILVVVIIICSRCSTIGYIFLQSSNPAQSSSSVSTPKSASSLTTTAFKYPVGFCHEVYKPNKNNYRGGLIV